MTSQHPTCNCGNDTFRVTATVSIPVHVGPSGAIVQIERLLGSITKVEGHCLQCGDPGDPTALHAARAEAITVLATVEITHPWQRAT